MNWLEDLERLVMRIACDIDGHLLSALRRLRRMSGMSVRTRGRGVAFRPRPAMSVPVPARGAAERPRFRHDRAAGAGAASRPDDQHLTSADVQFTWLKWNHGVIAALRNFAALRFLPMPTHGAAGWEIETPLREVVNTVGAEARLSKFERTQVYEAVLLAFVTLPLGMALPNPFGIVQEIDRIIADAPQISSAVLKVWVTVDDPMFWMAVAERHAQPAAV